MEDNVSPLIPLDQMAGFGLWCTDMTTDGFHISEQCDLPQTSETAQPLGYLPLMYLVAPEGAPGNVAQPFEPAPAISSTLGCLNPPQPPTINQSNSTGDPLVIRQDPQHYTEKEWHSAASAPDITSRLPAACLSSEKVPGLISAVRATAPSKSHLRSIPQQDQNPPKTSSLAEASQAGGDNASWRAQQQKGTQKKGGKKGEKKGEKKSKNKGKQKMATDPIRFSPYQQHVMELLMDIKREGVL
ncbi:hypothetical protein CSUB01_11042 [Colletotrichum sublineola]|uniref:Uncharacterized protein n=1 Tax=Colletotrichum sublineola TaxID=1173701 RepID=A0A066XIW1_COLSU|nr:hypothetical protein CSUB01_11042 [Colletotrichum sublineola]